MQRLKIILRNRLKSAQRVAVLGIGSELSGDDAVGTMIAKELKAAHIKKKKTKSVKVFLGQTAPENLTGEIKKFKPTHLVIIDAVDFEGQAGAVKIIDTDKEMGPSFSTHKMPVHIIKDYLCNSIGCETIIIGIQPQSYDFFCSLSDKIQQSVKKLSIELKDALNDD